MLLKWRRAQPNAEGLWWCLWYAGAPVLTVQPRGPICPFCWGVVEAEFVDVGLGGQGVQVTPYGCARCYSVQTRKGWERGEYVDQVPKATVTYEARLRSTLVAEGADPRAVRRRALKAFVNDLRFRIEFAVMQLDLEEAVDARS